MLSLENSVKQLRHLVCKRISLTTLSSIKIPVLIILLVVYVKDIVITKSDSKGILSLKSFLHNQLDTKDLEMLKYFLGVKVMRRKQGILLTQRKYILDML